MRVAGVKVNLEEAVLFMVSDDRSANVQSQYMKVVRFTWRSFFDKNTGPMAAKRDRRGILKAEDMKDRAALPLFDTRA